METAPRPRTWTWSLLDCEMSLDFGCWDHSFGPVTVSVQSGDEVTGLYPASVPCQHRLNRLVKFGKS